MLAGLGLEGAWLGRRAGVGSCPAPSVEEGLVVPRIPALLKGALEVGGQGWIKRIRTFSRIRLWLRVSHST